MPAGICPSQNRRQAGSTTRKKREPSGNDRRGLARKIKNRLADKCAVPEKIVIGQDILDTVPAPYADNRGFKSSTALFFEGNDRFRVVDIYLTVRNTLLAEDSLEFFALRVFFLRIYNNFSHAVPIPVIPRWITAWTTAADRIVKGGSLYRNRIYTGDKLDRWQRFYGGIVKVQWLHQSGCMKWGEIPDRAGGAGRTWNEPSIRQMLPRWRR